MTSPEVEALWRNNEIAGHANGVKHIRHPEVELIELEFSAFAVDGRMCQKA